MAGNLINQCVGFEWNLFVPKNKYIRLYPMCLEELDSNLLNKRTLDLYAMWVRNKGGRILENLAWNWMRNNNAMAMPYFSTTGTM